MKTETHTAGPWHYQATAGHHEFLIYCEATGKDVALVRDFHKANAALVAASPAMFAALEIARATIERLDARAKAKSAQGTLDVINAALASATNLETN